MQVSDESGSGNRGPKSSISPNSDNNNYCYFMYPVKGFYNKKKIYLFFLGLFENGTTGLVTSARGPSKLQDS